MTWPHFSANAQASTFVKKNFADLNFPKKQRVLAATPILRFHAFEVFAINPTSRRALFISDAMPSSTFDALFNAR